MEIDLRGPWCTGYGNGTHRQTLDQWNGALANEKNPCGAFKEERVLNESPLPACLREALLSKIFAGKVLGKCHWRMSHMQSPRFECAKSKSKCNANPSTTAIIWLCTFTGSHQTAHYQGHRHTAHQINLHCKLHWVKHWNLSMPVNVGISDCMLCILYSQEWLCVCARTLVRERACTSTHTCQCAYAWPFRGERHRRIPTDNPWWGSPSPPSPLPPSPPCDLSPEKYTSLCLWDSDT